MRPMIKSLAFLIAGGMALALSALPVRATPIQAEWTYYATSCSGCLPSTQFPLALGTFSSPDSSGTYSFYQSQFDPNPVVTGDSNFLFYFDYAINIPRPASSCLRLGYSSCGWSVTWDQSSSDLSINVMYGDGNIGMRLNDTLSNLSSDGIVPRCGEFTGCTFAGYWTTSSVPLPEPSSLIGLATAVLGFFAIMLRRGGGLRRRRAK
jgi:hypothetical protein